MNNTEIKGEAQVARRLPELPALARTPWSWTPAPLRAGVVSRALNALFSTALYEGELDFMDGRILNVRVADAGVEFSVGKAGDELRVSSPAPDADLFIEGTAYTFLLLASGEEDADTLFFRRQFKASGDTELGLFVKNFLAGLEVEKLPLHRIADPLLRSGLCIAERSLDVRRRISRLFTAAWRPRAAKWPQASTLPINTSETAT